MSECPVCQSQLRNPPSGWHADSHCSRCGGVWISAERLRLTLRKWKNTEHFIEEGPTADFCPTCGPVPLDEGTLLNQRGLMCGICGGVFLRKPLREPRPPSEDSSPPGSEPEDRVRGLLVGVSNPSDHVALVDESRRAQKDHQPHISAPALLQVSQEVPAQAPPPDPQPQIKRVHIVALLGMRDLIWFGGLALAIIASLLYWMNP